MIAESHSHLATSELEHVARYSGDLVCETAIKDKLSGQNAMGRSLTDSIIMVELIPKSVSCGHKWGETGYPGGGPPSKKHKPNPKDTNTLKNARKEKYRAMGNMSGALSQNLDMAPATEGPDPGSKRSVLDDQLEQKGTGGQKGQKKKGNAKGDGGRDTVASPSFLDFSYMETMGNKICALDGTNLRRLRDWLFLRSPGIIEHVQRIRKHCWNVMSRSLLDICDRNILASDVIRPNNILSAPTENFLAKWGQSLTNCLSELSGRTAEAATEKPQFARLK